MLPNLDHSIFPLKSTKALLHILGDINRDLLFNLASTAGAYYDPFDRLQKKGSTKKWRHIDNPTGDIKKIQKLINKRILNKALLSLPEEMIGGVKGKSTKDNAKKHLGQEIVVNIDLRDCFPNTRKDRIFQVWKNALGCGNQNAVLLTQLTSFQTRLPQGAATSPALCNLTLLSLFNDIKRYTDKIDINLSLYIDDFTLSGETDKVLGSIKNVSHFIQKHGYAVRRKKIVIMPSNVKQVVTGITVNKRISAGVEIIRTTRKQIMTLAKNRKGPVSLKSIKGRINYIKQLSSNEGQKLDDYLQMLLPDYVEDGKPSKREERRRCKSTKPHGIKRLF